MQTQFLLRIFANHKHTLFTFAVCDCLHGYSPCIAYAATFGKAGWHEIKDYFPAQVPHSRVVSSPSYVGLLWCSVNSARFRGRIPGGMLRFFGHNMLRVWRD